MAANKRVTGAAESLAFLAITAGVLILLNIGGTYVHGRQDFTEKRLFSLSHGSQRVASTLNDDMEVTAYFTSPLPPPFNATEQYVRNILGEYAAASNGHIHVHFVNPDDDDSKEAADHDGIQKVSHQVIEHDSVSSVDGYRGLVIKYHGDKKTIPVIEDTAGLEYQLTEMIKELANTEKTKIGLLSGHGGPTLSQGLSGLRDSLPTYDIHEVPATAAIPTDLRALLIISPETEITAAELHNIDAYVMQGGSLGIFGGTEKLDLPSQQQQGPSEIQSTGTDTHLNDLLAGWGMRLESNIVADAQCGRAPLSTVFGQVLVPFPPVPIVSIDEAQGTHPVLFHLDQVILPFTSSITLTGRLRSGHGVHVRALGKSTENAWLMTGDTISLQPRRPNEWVPSEQRGPFNLIAEADGRLPSAFLGQAMSQNGSDTPPPAGPDHARRDVRVLVVGTAAFMRDEFLPRPGPDGHRDLSSALAFALNGIDWLAQDSDLIAIRAKNVEDPALRVPTNVLEAEAEVRTAAQAGDDAAARAALQRRKVALEAWDGKKALYRWGNIVGIPVFVILAGLLNWAVRSSKRKRRMKL